MQSTIKDLDDLFINNTTILHWLSSNGLRCSLILFQRELPDR